MVAFNLRVRPPLLHVSVRWRSLRHSFFPFEDEKNCRGWESLSSDIRRCLIDDSALAVMVGETAGRSLPMSETPPKHYLLASDFDQTLSFKDSGVVFSELLGLS